MSGAAAPANYSGMLGGATFTLGIDDSSFKDKLIAAETQTQQTAKNIDKHMGGIELSAHRAHRGFHALALASGSLTGETRNLAEGFMRAGNFMERAAISFGASGPMFIGIMGLGVAIEALAQHWESIQNLFRDEGTRKQAKDMEYLAEETKKAAEEAERLLKVKSVPEQERTKATKEVIEQKGPPSAIQQGIEATLLAKPSEITEDDIQAEMKKRLLNRASTSPFGFTGTKQSKAEEAKLREEVEDDLSKKEAEARRKKASEMFSALNAGDVGALRETIEMTKKAPKGVFPEGLGKELAMQTPEERVRAKELTEEGAEGERAWRGQMERDKKEEEYSSKIDDSMTAAYRDKMDHARKDKEREIEVAEAKKGVMEAAIAAHAQTPKMSDDIKQLLAQNADLKLKEIDWHPAQMFGSTQEMLRGMQGNVLNDVPKQQLKELAKVNAGIEGLRQDVKQINKNQAAVLGK